jgi:DNA-binding MarR family transcriptional regulator
MCKNMETGENEVAVLEHLVQNGVTKEVGKFSIRKQLAGVKLSRKVVERIEKHIEYTPLNAMSFHNWVKKLVAKGLIEVDNTDKWNPTVRLTDKGEELSR